MSFPLPTDCLNEIFENLDDNKITLHSCLLVSRLWCKISVRILWRNIWRIQPFKNNYFSQRAYSPPILNTLVSCLPNESKELLHKNEVFISIPTSKQPLFNYAAFCKVLSINGIYQLIYEALSIQSQKFISLVAKEILQMFMNQVPSLKTLNYTYDIYTPDNIPLISFPRARDCLTDLSEFQCSTDINSEFFYGLSQICHNLRSLVIDFGNEVSNGFKELVSSQNNLKNLKLSFNYHDWADIVPALMKHTNTLTKLQLRCEGNLSLSFVSPLLNLQEIEFSFYGLIPFENFRELQYVTFPKLQVLKIPNQSVKTEYLTKFLEINGKNLQKCYLNHYVSDLSIDKFCPNLKKLFVVFDENGLDIMKTIFNSCQDLEGILISKKKELEIVAKYSPKNFYILQIHKPPTLPPEDLESFFISWGNRKSKKSLSLIIVDVLELEEENMKIIEKYKNLGVVKKFEFREYQYSDEDYYF